MRANPELISPTRRKKIRGKVNGKRSNRRWNVLAPLQIAFFWILVRVKFRYILGIYTVLLTVSLHYGSHIAGTLISKCDQSLCAHQGTLRSKSNPKVVHWSMSDAAKYALQRKLVQLRWEDKNSVVHTKIFIDQAKEVLGPFVRSDKHLHQTLYKLRAANTDAMASVDAIVFENLPTDPYVPPTPTDEDVRSLYKPTFVAEALLLAMGELAGSYTVGYKAETQYSNPWAHEGFPRQGHGGSALNSAVGTLNHHQDMSYQGVIPDLLGLICVREGDDPDVETTLISVESLIERLPKDVVSVLREKRFSVTASAQWVDLKAIDQDNVTAKAMLDGESLHLPVQWENMVGLDTVASKALESLKQVLRETRPMGLHLREGSMLLFNNQKVVHGRSPYYKLRYDGSDRVVIRSYFVTKLTHKQLESRML